ncbi:MAG: alpha/beta hydrolase [Firmicutes bacterium]|nr:alpha/beta hydrolase [Bacillota bacterium]
MLILTTTLNPWIIAAIAVAAFLTAASFAFFVLIISVIFRTTMRRNTKKKRTRECTNLKDEQQMMMFEEGTQWAEQFKDKTEQLHIVSHDKLNLYGEYINLGYDKCVVILQGRTESLLYSYYFADVYAKNGYNILVIDVRSHGLSDGKYQTQGVKESDDLILWIKLINEKYKIHDFALHGICIGAASAIYAYVKMKNEGSNLIKRIVTDGIFQSNYEIYKMHFKSFNKRAFPVLPLVFFFAFIFAGARLFKNSPMKCMKDIEIPILFIWSEKDLYSVKPKSEELFEACVSEFKEVAFFPEGRHSHVRSTQPEGYDEAIDAFLKKYL